MALPTAYLTSAKNLDGIFTALRSAKAPSRFTVRFLEGLGFKNVSDRLVIGVLKALGFLSDSGAPTDRYFRYLDDSQAKQVLAEGIEDAYGDLFAVNTKAFTLDRSEVKSKFKTLTQGQYSESVLDKMSSTFTSLCALADFNVRRVIPIEQPQAESMDSEGTNQPTSGKPPQSQPNYKANGALGGLVYNIQIVLPESRDPAIYDVLFKSLKDHLL